MSASTKSTRTIGTRRRQADTSTNGTVAKTEPEESTPEKPQRKRKKATTNAVKEENPQEEETESGERRQSKRLRGARSKVY